MTTVILSRHERLTRPRHHDDHSTFIVAVFFVAVLAAVAVAVAIAVTKIPDVGALYITAT
jgi:hypothetical protein